MERVVVITVRRLYLDHIAIESFSYTHRSLELELELRLGLFESKSLLEVHFISYEA